MAVHHVVPHAILFHAEGRGAAWTAQVLKQKTVRGFLVFGESRRMDLRSADAS
jgi:hypothetical protein